MGSLIFLSLGRFILFFLGFQGIQNRDKQGKCAVTELYVSCIRTCCGPDPGGLITSLIRAAYDFPPILLELPTLGKDALTCPLFCNKWTLLLPTLHLMRRLLEQDMNPKGGDSAECQEKTVVAPLAPLSHLQHIHSLHLSVFMHKTRGGALETAGGER